MLELAVWALVGMVSFCTFLINSIIENYKKEFKVVSTAMEVYTKKHEEETESYRKKMDKKLDEIIDTMVKNSEQIFQLQLKINEEILEIHRELIEISSRQSEVEKEASSLSDVRESIGLLKEVLTILNARTKPLTEHYGKIILLEQRMDKIEGKVIPLKKVTS